ESRHRPQPGQRSRRRRLHHATDRARSRSVGDRDRGPQGELRADGEDRVNDLPHHPERSRGVCSTKTLRLRCAPLRVTGCARHDGGSTAIGSTVLLPPRRTSKCTRGLAAPPELPALAMVWPFFTSSPFLTSSASLLP